MNSKGRWRSREETQFFNTRAGQREEALAPSRGMLYSWGQTSIISPPCVTDSMGLFICLFRGRHIRRLHVQPWGKCCTQASTSSVWQVNVHTSRLFAFFCPNYFQLPSPPPGWWRAGGIHGNLAVCWRRTQGAPCWPAPWTSVVRLPSAGAGTRKSQAGGSRRRWWWWWWWTIGYCLSIQREKMTPFCM